MSKKNRKYSKEFKIEAIRMLENSKRSASEVERELGITIGLLSKWKKELSQQTPKETDLPNKKKEQKETLQSLLFVFIPAFLLTLVNIVVKDIFPYFDKDYVDFISNGLLVLVLGLVFYLKYKQIDQRKWQFLLISIITLVITISLGYFIINALFEKPTVYFIVDASDNMVNQFSEVRPRLKINAQTTPDNMDLGMSVFGGSYKGDSGCNDIVELVPPSPKKESLPKISEAVDLLSETEPRGTGNLQGAVVSALKQLSGRKGLQRIAFITSNPSTTCEQLDRDYIQKIAKEFNVEFELIPLTVGDVSESTKTKLQAYATNKIYINTEPEKLTSVIETILNAPQSPYDLYYFGYYG